MVHMVTQNVKTLQLHPTQYAPIICPQAHTIHHIHHTLHTIQCPLAVVAHQMRPVGHTYLRVCVVDVEWNPFSCEIDLEKCKFCKYSSITVMFSLSRMQWTRINATQCIVSCVYEVHARCVMNSWSHAQWKPINSKQMRTPLRPTTERYLNSREFSA